MSSKSLGWARELRESLLSEINRLNARSLIDMTVKRRVAMYQQQLVQADVLIAFLEQQASRLADIA